MFLIKLTVLNNKSCKKVILEPSKTEPEVFIGVNDCGKTTILKSLDVFFDDKKSLYFTREDQQKSDLSNSPLDRAEINVILSENLYPDLFEYSGNIIAVICQFELEENDVDEEFQNNSKNNHLKWGIDDNKLILMRLFHNPEMGQQNFTGYYLVTRDYENNGEYLELWGKSAKELIDLKKKFQVSDQDIKNVNETGRYKNIENIEAIYSKITLEKRWAKYNDFSKDKIFLPSFKYLDWNFTLKELEEMATEAMNKVTEPLLQEIKGLVSMKQVEAVDGVNAEFEKMMGDLKNDLPQCIKRISSSVFFNVNQKVTDIKLEKENIDGEIHIDNQGDGIKRQIWFALLKWRSKLSVGENKTNKYIWCFDEPETHLYPAAQRQLFDVCKEMCKKEFQILLSTHSTVFIDRAKIRNVNQISLREGYTVIDNSIEVEDIFDCLGIQNSDFLFFDKFLAVEGPTEYELIPYLYKLKNGRSLFEDGIQVVNLKGKSQCKNNKEILESILHTFQKVNDKIYYLFDNDTGIVASDKIFLSGTYDLEDSISNKIWINFVKNNCNMDITDQILNDEIRSKLENKQDKKFHKLLSGYVSSKVGDEMYLPSKSDCGNLLTQCIIDVADIPEQINDLFTVLKS